MRLILAYFSDSPEVCGGTVVSIVIKVVLAIESLFVQFKVLFALLIGDPLGLFKVHWEGTTAAGCTRLASKDFLLHLFSVGNLDIGAVALWVVTVEASFNLALLLLGRCLAKGAAVDILWPYLWNVALIARYAILVLCILLLPSHCHLLKGLILLFFPDLGRLVTGVTWHSAAIGGSIVHHLALKIT